MSYRVEKFPGDMALDSVEFKRRLRDEGYDVFAWTDPPGARYDIHSHPEDQSHWIISGSLELTVAGIGVVLLASGDRDWMPAGTEHSARVAGDKPVHYLIGAKR